MHYLIPVIYFSLVWGLVATTLCTHPIYLSLIILITTFVLFVQRLVHQHNLPCLNLSITLIKVRHIGHRQARQEARHKDRQGKEQRQKRKDTKAARQGKVQRQARKRTKAGKEKHKAKQ